MGVANRNTAQRSAARVYVNRREKGLRRRTATRDGGQECSPYGLNELGSSGMPEDLERSLHEVPRQWFGRGAGDGSSTAMRMTASAHQNVAALQQCGDLGSSGPVRVCAEARVLLHVVCHAACRSTPHVAVQLIVSQAQAHAQSLRLHRQTCNARTGSEFGRIRQRAHRSLAHSEGCACLRLWNPLSYRHDACASKRRTLLRRDGGDGGVYVRACMCAPMCVCVSAFARACIGGR